MGKCVNYLPPSIVEPMCPGFAAPAQPHCPVLVTDLRQPQTVLICSQCGADHFHVTPVDFICCNCGASHSD